MNTAAIKDIWKRFSGRGTYPHQLAFLLLFPGRRLQLSPATLIRHLPLTRSSRVLEIGPGPGFFSIDVARAVPDGRLALVDIQIEMLRKARRRLDRASVRNAACTQASAAALPFQAGAFDVAFLVTVLGEVPDPKACLASIARVLRPGGLVSITELAGDPDALSETALTDFARGTDLVFVETVLIRGGFIVSFTRRQAAPSATSAA